VVAHALDQLGVSTVVELERSVFALEGGCRVNPIEIGSRVTPSERQGVGSSPARSLSLTLLTSWSIQNNEGVSALECICIYTYIYISIYLCVCVYICMYTYISICIYTYMHIYIYSQELVAYTPSER